MVIILVAFFPFFLSFFPLYPILVGQFPTSLYLSTHVDNSPHRCIFQLMWTIPHIAVSSNSCGQFPTSLYLPTHVDNSPHLYLPTLYLYLPTHVDNSPHRCIFQLMWTIPHIAVSSNSCGQFPTSLYLSNPPGQFPTSLYLPTHVDNSPHHCIFQLMWTIPHIAVTFNSCGQFPTSLYLQTHLDNSPHHCIFQLMWTIPHIAVSSNSCGQFPTSLYLPTHVDNFPCPKTIPMISKKMCS